MKGKGEGKEGERRRKEVKGEEVGERKGDGRKKGEEMEGEVKGEMVPHFLVQSDANISNIHTRRIGLATSN